MTIKTKRYASNIKRINKQQTITTNINLYECLSPNCKLIVSQEEFKKYIIGSNRLLNKFTKKRLMVELESAMNIYAKRRTQYVSTDTQFIKSQHNKRLYEMVRHFTNDMTAEIISIMIKYNMTDTIIVDFIKSQYVPKKEITEYKMSKIADKIYKYTKHIETPKILDIGTGNGKKIKMIQKLINCDIYGADIKEWGRYKENRNIGFPYKVITFDPYNIPYTDNMFDCITLILSLHHCENIIETINECKRLLTSSGIILIIEHDIWTDTDHMIIDLQHRIYKHIFNEPEHTPGCYFNFFEWDIIFNKCNMEPIYGDRITDDVSFNIRYDLQFMGIYRQKI